MSLKFDQPLGEWLQSNVIHGGVLIKAKMQFITVDPKCEVTVATKLCQTFPDPQVDTRSAVSASLRIRYLGTASSLMWKSLNLHLPYQKS